MLIGFQRIAAHQFGEAIGLVRRRRMHGPHLPKNDAISGLCDLQRCFGTGESSAGNVNRGLQLTIIVVQETGRAANERESIRIEIKRKLPLDETTDKQKTIVRRTTPGCSVPVGKQQKNGCLFHKSLTNVLGSDRI